MKSLEGTGEDNSHERRSPPGSPLAGDTVEDTGWYGFLEDMLARSAEEAQGYRIMHEKAYKHYHKISTRLTIPAIILSTLTGVANFGQSSLEPYLGTNAPLFIGAVSIVAAVFSTIAKYLRADEKSELNRSAMIQWDKLHRMLVTVLSQPRGKRVEAQEFLLQYREERNRLSEQMPVIPYKIRSWFMHHYGQQYSATIQRPGILSIADVPVYRADTPGDDEPAAAQPSARGGPASRHSPLPRPAGTASPSHRGPSPRPVGSRMAAVSSHFLPSRPSPPPGNSAAAAAGGARLAQVMQMARMRQAATVAESAISETATRAAETAATAAAVAVGNAATRAVNDALGKITRDFSAAGPRVPAAGFAPSVLPSHPAAPRLPRLPGIAAAVPLGAAPSAFLASQDPNRRDSSSSGSIADETGALAMRSEEAADELGEDQEEKTAGTDDHGADGDSLAEV
jgi:hypothetical protein